MTTTNKIYNAAIIGCGKIASDLDPGRDYIVTHAGAYTNLKNTNLVSISDINHNKLQESGKK
jgi:predicted dehydrogenase